MGGELIRSMRGVRLPGMVILPALVGFLLWMTPSADAKLRRGLGVDMVSPATHPEALTVSLASPATLFEPEAGIVAVNGWVTFRNSTDSAIVIRTTVPSPNTFAGRVAAHGQLRVQLTRPGLYHYYDALTARPLHVVANNEVLRRLPGVSSVLQGWVAVLPRSPASTRSLLYVPAGQDLFSPKALVTVVGGTVVLTNHDADAHNFVIDPASPAGAAFVIDGTDNEPPHGWRRSLVIQKAGLYHVYCTMHTQVMGTADGWHMVMPRFKASGYKDHNAMEAWIVALPLMNLSR
jgi:plastocyanin